MRVRFELFFILTAIGKGARYAVVYLIYAGFFL
jgi:membrane protein YqaA with SNARE-associated domain